MYIFYGEDGAVKFTMNGDPSLVSSTDAYIEVPEQSLSDLSVWRVIDGELVLYDLEPARLAFRELVNAKRLRLITDGVDVTITGHGTVALQGRPEDQTSLQGLAFGAQLRLAAGDSTTLMDFLDRNNDLHQLVPMQMLELWQKGAAFISAIYAKSWEIKEMDPWTTDVENPAIWAL